MTHNSVPVITIDGASGTGKGTVSSKIAQRLGWHFLDSGILYRVLAFAAYNHSITLNDEKALAALADHLDVQFIAIEGDIPQILLEGENVTSAIRSEKIGNAASIVGAFPSVRAALLARQHAFRKLPGLVTDGRDMGTIVFPDANLKIFLRASLKERALRRYNQLKEQGISVTLSDLLQALSERDKRDQDRAVAPLKPAADAVCIDTDRLTITEVVNLIWKEIKRKKAFPAISNLEVDFAFAGVAE